MADRYTKIVLTVIAAALVWLCLWGPTPKGGTPAEAAGQAKSEVPEVIRAQRFELVDREGRVSAVLGGWGAPRLVLYDKDGQERVKLGVGPGLDGAHLKVRSTDGGAEVSATALLGVAFLSVREAKGTEMELSSESLCLSAGPKPASPTLPTLNPDKPDEYLREVERVAQEYRAKQLARHRFWLGFLNGSAALVLYDRDGDKFWSAP